MTPIYLCIDLKSFYASVECRERGLDPLKTNLVVADESRTDKTICLAITPSLKKYGLKGRARLYEVKEVVRRANYKRRQKGFKLTKKSYDDEELNKNPHTEIDFLIAKPRMIYYMKYSTKIFQTYLEFVSKEDIYSYSIDEVFIDITSYLKMYQKTPEELATMIMKRVYDKTGITATCGIGTNLYLAKVAMDIEAKHMEPNDFGVRIAFLDEKTYRYKLWTHEPLTDFWRVGKGTQEKLLGYGIKTMGDIALCSHQNEELLYKLFGVTAETLIDHAWGYEPLSMKQIKNCRPVTKSISRGQVLSCPYEAKNIGLVVREMVDLMSYELVEHHFVTSKIVLHIGYDVSNLNERAKYIEGGLTNDMYGRKVPKPSHGTINLHKKTASSKILCEYALKLLEEIINPHLLVRRITIYMTDLASDLDVNSQKENVQFDLFANTSLKDEEKQKEQEDIKDEKQIQKVILDIKNKYGKNAILKGMNLEKGATARERNQEIGGHNA